ncbi:ribosome maturation factor RimM [Celerinatantimonas yamalensis]|uniref:Ribosome maturation factor RimM n=1 Tax=Celerinatantimonas yamalensis TaxID=559956 RepID=A0ABW9GA01_9GAMM
MSHPDVVIVGRLGAVYGIKGWLKINSFTEQHEAIFDYPNWLIGQDNQWQSVVITEWRRHNNALIAKFEGYDAREQSQTLTGMEIGIASDQLATLADDEFYWRDLLGMKVVNRQGYDLGQVTDLMETGSNDVLVVKANLKDAFGKKERLIPFIESQMIDSVDQQAQVITVDWDPDF